MSRKFWNFVSKDGEERTLYLEGAIADETWWGDEVTPKLFKDDLLSGSGDVTVWINSPGRNPLRRVWENLSTGQVYNPRVRRRADLQYAQRVFRQSDRQN